MDFSTLFPGAADWVASACRKTWPFSMLAGRLCALRRAPPCRPLASGRLRDPAEPAPDGRRPHRRSPLDARAQPAPLDDHRLRHRVRHRPHHRRAELGEALLFSGLLREDDVAARGAIFTFGVTNAMAKSEGKVTTPTPGDPAAIAFLIWLFAIGRVLDHRGRQPRRLPHGRSRLRHLLHLWRAQAVRRVLAPDRSDDLRRSLRRSLHRLLGRRLQQLRPDLPRPVEMVDDRRIDPAARPLWLRNPGRPSRGRIASWPS